MANNDDIVQNLRLEGSAEFLAGVQAMAAGTVKAFADIEKAAVKAGGGIDQAGSKVSQSGAGFSKLKGNLADVESSFENLARSASSVGTQITSKFTSALAALGVALTLTGFAKFIADTAKAADELDTLARITGSTTQELQGIQFAAANASVGTEELNNALRLLERSLGQAQQDIINFNNKMASIGITASRAGDDLRRSTSQQLADLKTNEEFQNKLANTTTAAGRAALTAEKAVADIRQSASRQAQQNFLQQQRAIEDLNREFENTPSIWRRLKIAVTEGDGSLRGTLAVLSDLADEFKKLPDGPQKTAFALEALGRQGAQLIPLLNEGSAAIKAFAEEAKRVAPPLTALEVTIGNKFQVALLRLGKAFESVSASSAALIQPAATDFFNSLTRLIGDNRDAILGFVKDVQSSIGDAVKSFGEFKDQVVSLGKELNALLPTFEDIKNFKFSDIGKELTQAIKGIRIAIEFLKNSTFKTLTSRELSLEVFAEAAKNIDLADEAAGKLNLGLVKVISSAEEIDAAFKKIAKPKAGTGPGGDFVKSFVAGGARVIQFGEQAQQTLSGVGAAGQKAGEQASSSFISAGSRVIQFSQTLSQALEEDTSRVKQTFEDLGLSIEKNLDFSKEAENLRQSVTSALSPLPDELGAIFLDTQARLVDAFNQLAEQVQPSADKFADAFTTANDRVEQSFQDLERQVEQTFQSMEQDAVSAASRIDSAFNDLQAGGGGGGGGQGFASGGFVQGPGSSTSDSILARLSAGEFVISARAVRKYGVGVMSMINSLRAPLGGLRGFADGGFVSALMGPIMSGIPRFATGGPVVGQGGGKSVNLHIGQDVFKLFARDNDTLNKLERAAIRKEMTSAGRKPSYYR